MPYFSDQARRANALPAASVAATCAVATIAVPFFAFVAAIAGPVVMVLFGSSWVASANYVPILCLAAAIRVPTTFANRLAVVANRLDLSFRAFCLTMLAQVIALLLAAHGSLTTICFALTGAACIHAIVWGTVSRKIAATSGFWQALQAVWLPSVAVGLVGLAGNFLGRLAGLSSFLTVAASGAVAAIAWLYALRLSRNPLYVEIWEMIETFTSKLPIRRA
jgi:O-antigen/teichoic acid export membrane protein